MSIGTITEAKVKEIFKDEFERYFRETHGTFVIEGGCPTDRHEPAEYSMTTQSAQGISFYEGGIGKMRAGKNLEIYSGDDASIGDGKVTGEGGNAFKVECKHGRIVLIAKSSDIELRGRNISLVATKNIHLNAKINTTLDTGNDMNIWAKNDMNLDSNKELFINGGNAVGIHCEADVIHTTSGRDEEDAPDFYKDFSGFYDPTVPQVTSKIDRFNGADDLRG